MLASLTNKIKLLKFRKQKSIKLNIGSGNKKLKGWINVDLNRDADLIIDIRKGLPFYEKSVDFIFNEHFLEHLSLEEGQHVLKEFHRVLKEGGVLRIALPDLDYVISKYGSDWKNQAWLSDDKYQFIETKGQMINFAFRGWNHKYLYNREDLRAGLIKAGFKKIETCEIRKSNYKELDNLEVREDSKLIIEAQK